MIVYRLNSFSLDGKGGNPAGVVLDTESIDDTERLAIARKVGFSETVFVEKSNIAEFKLGFFTPSNQVELCGHATIAAFHLLRKLGLISDKKYSQETLAGIQKIRVEKDNIWMSQNLPQFDQIIAPEKIAKSLNISLDQIDQRYPIQIVSTGLRDIIIPIKTVANLNEIEPNFKMISQISQQYNVIGYHIFTVGCQDFSAQCRNFAPLYAIEEEAATGTASGALAAYLCKHQILPGDYTNLTFLQGVAMQQASEIKVSLEQKDNKIVQVWVGGSAGEYDTVEIWD